jgi:hypothetical protein
MACVSASHHLQRIGNRTGPRPEACTSPTIYTDRGPDRPRETLAIVTAECSRGRPEECRRHLQLGACDAGGDAVIEVTDRIAAGVRRMVGTVVQYTDPPSP